MKRKSRDKIDDDSYDVLKPIDITIFGTDSDPCFGKHYDSGAPECGRCGDAQICQIICAQLQNKKRDKVEKSGNFKDKDTEIDNFYLNLKDISNSIEKLLKKRGDQPVTKVVRYIKTNFDPDGKSKKGKVMEAVKKVVKDHPQMRTHKKQDKRYIKWKS